MIIIIIVIIYNIIITLILIYSIDFCNKSKEERLKITNYK